MTQPFRYVEHLNLVIDSESGIRLTEEQCKRILSRWLSMNDELLRSGIPADRIIARQVRQAFLDLSDAIPAKWEEEPRSIQNLVPLNVSIRGLDPDRWAVVPGSSRGMAERIARSPQSGSVPFLSR
jgi:hypothetical protein